MLGGVSFEWVALNDAFAFADYDPLIRIDALHRLHFALGPPDRQIRLRGAPHAEVHAEVSLRDVVSAAANFVNLASSASSQRQSRTDRVPARDRDGADQQRVAFGSKVLQQ